MTEKCNIRYIENFFRCNLCEGIENAVFFRFSTATFGHFWFCIRHCSICRLSDSTVLEGARIVSNKKYLVSFVNFLRGMCYFLSYTGIILQRKIQRRMLIVLGSCQNYQNGALMTVLIACDPCGSSARGMYWLDLFTYIFISTMCICTNLQIYSARYIIHISCWIPSILLMFLIVQQ